MGMEWGIPSGADPAGSPCHSRLLRAQLHQQCPSKAPPHANVLIQRQDEAGAWASWFANTLCPAGGKRQQKRQWPRCWESSPLAFKFFIFTFHFLSAKVLTRHKPEPFPPPGISGSARPAPRSPSLRQRMLEASTPTAGNSTTTGVKEENPPEASSCL